jgi:hypothetical protein
MNIGKAIVNGLSDGLSTFATFIPKLLGFLLILLIGYLIAKGLTKALGFLLSKVGFEGMLERAGLAKFTKKINFDITGLILKLVFYFIMLIVLQFAFSAFGPNPVAALLNQIVAFLPRIIVAIILVVVAATIARVVKDLLLQVLQGKDFANVVSNIGYVVILALGIIAAINQIGIGAIITGPILIFVLATVGGILIVGLGGGLIKPVQGRWEQQLQSLESKLADQPAAPRQPQHQQSGPAVGEGGQPDQGGFPTGQV